MWKQIGRYVLFLVLLVGSAGLCACQKEKEVIKEKEPDFVYPAEEVVSFCLDAESNLYTCEADGKSIRVYDKSGVKTREIPVEEGKYTNLCIEGDTLYSITFMSDEETGAKICTLVEIVPAENRRTILYQNPLVWAVNGMELINGSLYFMEKVVYDVGEAAELGDMEGGYSYYGEKLMRFDPVTREAEEVPAERLKGFCKKDEESLWLYAYDIEVGEFYFAEYNGKTGLCGEKYHGGQAVNGFLWNLVYDNTYGKLLYMDETKAAMLAVEPENANNRTSVLKTEARLENWSDLQYRDGYTYFLSGGQVTRVKNSNYIRDNVPLKIYSTSFYDLPEGTGFNLNLEHVNERTMAMTLMAGDSDYDMLILSTSEPLAQQIRRIGAYEPLNKVEGVTQYLETGFDYIKEAATTENGAVWMLPYEVDCEVLLYNPEVCARYGIDMEAGYSHEKLLELQKALAAAEAGAEPAYYELGLRYGEIMDQYLADYAVVDGSARFDTALFRHYSELIKKEYNQGGFFFSKYSRIAPGNVIEIYGKTEEQLAAEFLEYFSNVAAARVNKRSLFQKYGNGEMETFGFLNYDFLKAKPLPSLEEQNPQKSIAEAVFLVLNPKSKHLTEAKEYLSVLAERLGSEESICRTKELSGTYNALEQSLHELYGDARIVFSYPDDVFSTEYVKYLRGEKTLDEVIPELERKLNTYLRE